MRVLFVATTLLLSLPAALSSQTWISAAQVHRACSHPRLQAEAPEVYQVCGLPASGQVKWADWLAVRTNAASLGQQVLKLQNWDAGAIPVGPVVQRAVAEPGGQALATDLYAAFQLNDPEAFAAAVVRGAPAVARRTQEWWARERPTLDRLGGLQYAIPREEAATPAGAVLARVLDSPMALPAELALQPAAVQHNVLASLTGQATVAEFLARYRLNATSTQTLLTRAQQVAGASGVSSLSLAAALPVNQQSAVLWGVTDFVVSRAEQQMQTYFLQQFSSSFCGRHQAILPTSCSILNGTTLRTFRPGLGMLRQAVRQDMEALPSTLLRTGIASNVIPPEHWDAVNVAASGALFTVDVLRGTDPTQALRRMADSILSKQVDGMDAPVSRLLGQFAGLQAGLLGPAGNLLNPFPDGVPAERQVQRLLLAFAINQPTYWPHLDFAPERLARVSSDLHSTVGQYRELKENVVRLQRTLADTAAALRAARQTYMISTSQLADAVLEAATRAGLTEAARLRAAVAPLRGIALAMVNADYTTAALSTFQLAAPYQDVFKTTLPASEMRVFSFVADLAQAEDPAAVSAALTRFAGSGGDFQGKRTTTSVRFTVNAYLGLYGGGSWPFGESRGWGEELDDGRVAAFAGAYLPIGVEATLPQPRLFGGRFGLFLQAVDVGALASLRLGEDEAPVPADSVQGEPEVGFAQVFSPGIGLVYHIPKIPWSIGYVYSYSPSLRTLGGKDEERTSDVVRGGLFIAFDIPLFP